MASMLRCHYDIAEKDDFGTLFGGLKIARHPTENRNRYHVLHMDFSRVNRGVGETLQARIENYIGVTLGEFIHRYGNAYGEPFRAEQIPEETI